MSIHQDEKRLFYLMEQAHSRLFKETNRNLKKTVGISVAQSSALFLLEAKPELTLGELAKALNLRQSAITGLIDRMEKNQLLVRKKDSNDGRIIRTELSSKGRLNLKLAKEQLKLFNQKINQGYSEPELKVIRRFLIELANGFPFTNNQVAE